MRNAESKAHPSPTESDKTPKRLAFNPRFIGTFSVPPFFDCYSALVSWVLILCTVVLFKGEEGSEP